MPTDNLPKMPKLSEAQINELIDGGNYSSYKTKLRTVPRLSTLNAGLDPEILTLSGGLAIPASFFLDPPTRDADGKLNPLSFDNAAVELRPEHSLKLHTLAKNAGKLLHTARLRLRLARMKRETPPDSEFSLIPAVELHHKARDMESVSTFGCEPSMVVEGDYSTHSTVPSCSPQDTPVRSAGFHIHHEMQVEGTEQMIVPILDGILGLNDVIANHRAGWNDASRLRRLTLGYGKAGEYRVREAPSGKKILEYRVMSPWPMSNPVHLLWVTAIMRSVCTVSEDSLMAVLDACPERQPVMDAINDSNSKQARLLFNYFRTAWRGYGGPIAHQQFPFSHYGNHGNRMDDDSKRRPRWRYDIFSGWGGRTVQLSGGWKPGKPRKRSLTRFGRGS